MLAPRLSKIYAGIMKIAALVTLTLPLAMAAAAAQDRPPDLEAKLKQFLERFPDADANKDGTLTREEVRAFNQKRRDGSNTARQRANRPEPTHPDVAYGEHEKQRFDLWPVEGAENRRRWPFTSTAGDFVVATSAHFHQER